MDTPPPPHHYQSSPPRALNHSLSSPHTMPALSAKTHRTPAHDSFSHKLSSKTHLLGLKLYILIAIALACLIIIALPIFICICSNRRSKRRKMRVKSHGSTVMALKSPNEIVGTNGSDRVDEVSKIGSYYEREEKEVSDSDVELGKLVGGKIRSSGSNLSSLSEATSLGSAAAAEGTGMGWGRWYSWSELEAATRGFDEGNVIGEGGYGIVYRGVLVDGSVVAVKNLLNNK